MKTKIIYEDKHIMVCYKPAGLATQTARVGQQDMVSELKNYLAGKVRQQSMQPDTEKKDAQKKVPSHAGKKSAQPYLGIIHRLDQPVEGLLVFAKDSASAAKLTAQLSQGTLNKQYYAVVCGQPQTKSAELVDYLTKDEASGSAVVVTEQEIEQVAQSLRGSKMQRTQSDKVKNAKNSTSANSPKKAVLQYHVLGQTAGSGCERPKQDITCQASDSLHLSTMPTVTLLDIHIDTGRFHQIRAQMAHAGLPLLGDSRYGNEISAQISRDLQVRNVALCAYKIILKHPVTGNQMEFSIKPEGKIFSDFSII